MVLDMKKKTSEVENGMKDVSSGTIKQKNVWNQSEIIRKPSKTEKQKKGWFAVISVSSPRS